MIFHSKNMTFCHFFVSLSLWYKENIKYLTKYTYFPKQVVQYNIEQVLETIVRQRLVRRDSPPQCAHLSARSAGLVPQLRLM